LVLVICPTAFQTAAFEIMDKGNDVFFYRVPRTHQAAAALADETVKDPAARVHGVNDGLRQLHENRVGLARE
jgi:hypothetical protein